MSWSVYMLCAATSLLCALLLLRSYWRSGMKLLLWSGLCFVCLALENAILFVDLMVYPEVDLGIMRRLTGLTGLVLLLYGLVWDAK